MPRAFSIALLALLAFVAALAAAPGELAPERLTPKEARGHALAGAVLGLADCLLWAGFLLWIARARPR